MLPCGHEVHTSADFSQVVHEESQDSNFLFPSGVKGDKSSIFYHLVLLISPPFRRDTSYGFS